MGIFFIKRCVLCSKMLDSNYPDWLCEDCAETIASYSCKQINPIHGADDAVAALYYSGTVKSAMRAFKFRNKKQYAAWFAEKMYAALTPHLSDWRLDLITFAPIGWLRYRERGYNQAELLAGHIAKFTNVPCQAVLKKRAFIARQSGQKDAISRRKNAENAFSPKENISLEGKSILFIDDIITTGATASAAVQILRQMGASHVYVLAATHTPPLSRRDT